MGFSAFYTSSSSVPEEQKIAVFREAVRQGVTLFNSATFYGPLNEEGFGSNLRLIRKCLEGIDRSSIRLMVKVGMDTRSGAFVNLGTAESIRADVDYALQQLGTDYIDIVVLCRIPTGVPMEEYMGGLKSVLDQGKARAIALSEASAKTIRAAHEICPLYCIEQEWNLYARDLEREIVPTCRELGIKIVAYSPLGRGFLTGAIQDVSALDSSDFRRHLPKFSAENFEDNKRIVDKITEIASRLGITVGQLSLAWLNAQGADVIPIPGTSSIAHLHSNLAARNVILSPEVLAEIKSTLDSNEVRGDRYAYKGLTFDGNN